MKKCTYAELKDIFNEYNKKKDAYENPMFAIIMIKDFCNGKKYNFRSRCYVTSSNSWGWDYSKSGRCKIGSCADGSERVRLDWYLDDGTWKVGCCYIIKEEYAKRIIELY